MQKSVCIVFACLLATAAYAQSAPSPVRVRVGDVKDTRTTGQFFAKLEIELIAMGDVFADAAQFRARVTRAVDETGRDLLDPENDDGSFEEVDSTSAGQATTTIELKNPSRSAMSVRDLSGELDIYVPKRDPRSTVTVDHLLAHTREPLTAPALQAAQVTVTLMTKGDYEAYKAEQEQKAKAAAAQDAGQALGQAFADAFSQLFAGFTAVGDNSIILRIHDPQARVIGVKFEEASGAELATFSRMSMGDVRVFNFQEPVPDTARLRIYLATDKAVLTLPFRLTEIPLP